MDQCIPYHVYMKLIVNLSNEMKADDENSHEILVKIYTTSKLQYWKLYRQILCSADDDDDYTHFWSKSFNIFNEESLDLLNFQLKQSYLLAKTEALHYSYTYVSFTKFKFHSNIN